MSTRVALPGAGHGPHLEPTALDGYTSHSTAELNAGVPGRGISEVTDEEELVTVYSTDIPWEVPLIRLWLDSADIHYITLNEALASIYPVGVFGGVKFQVRRQDVPKAIEVLRAHDRK